MKTLIICIISVFSLTAFSGSVEVIPDAKNVQVDETFGMTIKVETDSGNEPQIKMTGLGVTILEKEQQGVSSTTTIVNGSISSKKEYVYRYQLKVQRVGQSRLRNIRVIDGKKTLRHADVVFYGTREQKFNKDIFVKAEPSKMKVYQGEGILLRYFLYNRVQVAKRDIKKFPKLKNFVKRFIQEPPLKETFIVNGERYQRSLLYSTILYAEKVGNIKIDPLVAEISFPRRSRGGSPFDRMGFGIRNYTKRTFSSSTLRVEVLPLPDGAPAGFTGLVGKHSFKLTHSKEKFLVNEPIEFKLTVNGTGNLENYEAPELIEDVDFENFEDGSEIEISRTLNATKVFNLTYLPRNPKVLSARDLNLTYFNPDTQAYEGQVIRMPSITVRGGAIASTGNDVKKEEQGNTQLSKSQFQKNILLSPYFENFDYPLRWSFFLMLTLGLVCLGLILFSLLPLISFKDTSEVTLLLNEVRKSNLSYSSVYNFLWLLDSTNTSILKKIDQSSLSKKAKLYFRNILNSKESVLYGDGKKVARFNFKSKYFNEAKKIINDKNIIHS